MINGLEIANFRAIQKITLEGFAKINIFVGGANMGKTSVLEALYLYLADHPEAITNVLESRSMATDEDCFLSLFYDYNTNHPIRLQAKQNKKLTLSCNPHLVDIVLDTSQKASMDNQGIMLDDSDRQGMNTIVLDYADSPTLKQIKVSKVFPNPFQIQFENFIKFIDHTHPLFTSKSEWIFDSLVYGKRTKKNLKSFIENKNKKKLLLEYLQKFSINIQDITILEKQIMIQKDTLDNMVSLKTMGAGFQKYLAIILAILNQKEYIFIDEIENGLHFEKIDLLLRGILYSPDDVQFFITTHNVELLRHLNKFLSSKDNGAKTKERDTVALFNIYEDKNGLLCATRYSQANFTHAIQTDTETRN